MEYLFAASAGIGRVVGEDSDWQSLDPQPKSASWAARYAVDPDAWAITGLESGEDPKERLELERDRADAFRLLMILLDAKTSPATFEVASNALQPLLRPSVEQEVKKWVLARPLFETKKVPWTLCQHGGVSGLLRSIHDSQAPLSVLWQAFNAVPDECFVDLGRDDFYSRGVSSGLVRTFLFDVERGRVPSTADLLRSNDWILPEHAAVLREWAAACGAAQSKAADCVKIPA